MKKLEMIIKPGKLDDLRELLEISEYHGIMITYYGVWKSKREYRACEKISGRRCRDESTFEIESRMCRNRGRIRSDYSSGM